MHRHLAWGNFLHHHHRDDDDDDDGHNGDGGLFCFIGQNDDPSGPNIDLAPGSLQEKKMDVEKRGMGMTDYNGDMRKGGRGGGGMSYRSPVSKEAAPGDAGSYYDKVASHCQPQLSLSLVSR